METTYPCECVNYIRSNKAKGLEHKPAANNSELCEDCEEAECKPWHTNRCDAITVADVWHY